MSENKTNNKMFEEYDGYMVESKDEVVTEESIVCISPYNTQTNEWLSEMMEITSMEDLLSRDKKKVTKDMNVQIFMEEHFAKTKTQSLQDCPTED